MDEIVKKFVVSTAWAHRRIQRMYQATGTLNARKMGRTRRGGWMLTGFSGDIKDDNTTLVSVRLRKAPRMGVTAYYQNNREIRRVDICPYRHDDIGKVLKDLSVAARRCAAHAAACSA